MKRLSYVAAIAAIIGLAVGLIYPYEGVWLPAQIQSASVDGQSVPRDRIAELYWDLQKSRFADAPSKRLGWVELQLTNGSHKQVRLSESIAVSKWSSDGSQHGHAVCRVIHR